MICITFGAAPMHLGSAGPEPDVAKSALLAVGAGSACQPEKCLLRLLAISSRLLPVREGTSARHSIPSTDRTCSLVRKPRSLSSRRPLIPTPSAPPAKIAANQTITGCGKVLIAEAGATG